MAAPPQEVIDAILNGITTVTRRCEIYEKDAVTPWRPKKSFTVDDDIDVIEAYRARMITGSVGVDSSRDERRNIDVTFDNKDGVMTHSPDDFWYDKIVKVFRGIKYVPKKVDPKIAVLGNLDDSAEMRDFIQAMGYANVTYFDWGSVSGTQSVWDVNTYAGYDIIVTQKLRAEGNWPVPNAMIIQLYNMGKSIVTMGDTWGTENPLIASVSTYTSTDGYASVRQIFTQSALGSPFVNFKPFGNYSGASYHTSIETVPANTLVAGTVTTTYGGGSIASKPAILYQSNPISKGKWAHYHGTQETVKTYYSSSAAYRDARGTLSRIIKSMIEWSYVQPDSISWETQVGEFMIDSISTQRHPKQIKVVGRDYTKKLMDSKFDQTVSFAASTNLNTLIRQIATNAGITKFKLNAPAALQLGSLQSFTNKTSRWEAIKKMCDDLQIEIFFDAFGYLVTRPFVDPATAVPTFIVRQGGSQGNVIDYSESSNETEMYNRVVAYGTSPDSEATAALFTGIAENHNASLKTSIENLGYVKTFYIESTTWTSQTLANNAAKIWLNIKGLEAYDFNYDAIVFPWLEAGDVMRREIPDSLNGEPENYLHESFTIPLELGSMSGSARRLVIVSGN